MLFRSDMPREQRTEEYALSDLQRAFELIVAEEPDARFAIDPKLRWPDDTADASSDAMSAFVTALPAFIQRYFQLERPESFEATHRERYVRGQVADDLWLHGYVDRIDVAPSGEVRIVDYKTGKSPAAGYEEKALFQLKCYALLWQREHDVPVRRLVLLYLGDGQRLAHDPSTQEISRVVDSVVSVWDAMKTANERAEWKAKPSRLCDWCSFQQRCPAKSSHTPRFEPVAIEYPES